MSKNEECQELKNIKYKSMLQNSKKSDDIDDSLSFDYDIDSGDSSSFGKNLENLLKDDYIIEDNLKVHSKDSKDLFKLSQNVLKSFKNRAKNGKPIGVIIIDDVSFKKQVDTLNALNITLTMSFLPSTPIHPNSTKLAHSTKNAMIHLPLEALNFGNEETDTLRVGDSYEVIENRIKSLREDFPHLNYVNNHTGSKFSSNYRAVKHLVKAMTKYNFRLLDSKTSPKSKIRGVLKEFKEPYFVRDVFIDNEADVQYIKKQIRLAIKKAKSKGYVVIIGHPRVDTIRALRELRGELSELNLISVDELYSYVLGR